MKKAAILRTVLGMMLCILLGTAICAHAADPVVFLDGTGQTAGAETTLKAAATAVKSGGTIVVCGETTVSSGFNMETATGKVTLTSVFGGVDYRKTNGAKLILSYRSTATSTAAGQVLGTGGETLWEHITLVNGNASVPQMIAFRGFKTTVGEDVTCEATGTAYPSLIGCYLFAAASGKTVDLTVQSGKWHSIYGGNWQGTFTGDSTVNFTGGTVLHTLTGAGYRGGFKGNAVLNIGGDAVVEYDSSAPGVVGGLVGISGGTAYPFEGSITVNVGGNAAVRSNILGASRYTNITTTADIGITVGENAHLYRHIYGGGYGNVTGDVTVTLRDNVTVTAPSGSSSFICAGANSGTVDGNTAVKIYDNVNIAFGNVYAGGYSGSVTGDSLAELHGGTVSVTFSAGSRSGNVGGNATTAVYGGSLTGASYGLYANGGTSGTVTGKATAILDGGSVAGTVKLVPAKIGSGEVILRSGSAAAVEDKALIDLTGGKSLSLGGNVTASDILGTGTLSLSGSLRADTVSGDITLAVSGTPTAGQTYLTVADTAMTGSVTYAAQDDETLVREVGDTVTYTVRYADRYETTHVRVYYYNPLGKDKTQPKIVLYSSTSSDPNRVSQTLTKGVEDGIPYAEVDLVPGFYYYKVYYGSGGSDYETQYFIVTGKEESHTYTCALEPLVADSYMEPYTAKTTAEVMDAFFNSADLTGFAVAPTPTFTLHADDRAFMSNEEMCAYIDALSSPYLYRFYYEIGTDYDNRMPVLVFTKDAIPAGATLEEIGETVRGGGVRDIFMIDGGIHGNEPTGPEAALWYAQKLCGDYGETVLDAFGAILILPDACPDNHERFKRTYEDGINPNRDLMALSHRAGQIQSYVYQQFMPTVFVDCHEDYANEDIDPSDYSIKAITDIRFDIAGLPNSPAASPNGLLDGSAPLSENGAYKMMRKMITEVGKVGLHTNGYFAQQYNPGVSASYAKLHGSYAFLFEAMRIWTGKQRFDRSVFAMETALETMTALIMEADGAIAEEVAAGRAATPVTAFDPDNRFITKMATGGDATYTVVSPSVYMNGTVKNADKVDTIKEYDTPVSSIAMATGYVLDAGAENLADILALCDKQGVRYTKIVPGSTLTLKKYALGDPVSLGNAEEVCFAFGAYVFCTDDVNAYLTTYLFEPESFATTDTTVSLRQMGLLTAADGLYRSETDFLASVIEPMTEVPEVLILPLESGKIALLSVIDSLHYASVGFTLTLDGEVRTFMTDTVYTAVTNEKFTYTPATFGASGGYVVGLIVTDLPAYESAEAVLVWEETK